MTSGIVSKLSRGNRTGKPPARGARAARRLYRNCRRNRNQVGAFRIPVRIYLDHAATTPIRPEARAAMAEAMERWANPSSPHAEGRAARAALEGARERIKAALSWDGDLIFTGGASEAIGLAIGRTMAARIAVSAVEHDAVLRAATEATIIPVGREGVIDAEASPPDGEATLFAIQHVNSETGIIQPLTEIAAAIHACGGWLLADSAQSAGKLPLPPADMVVVSAHKLGGPPGVGALLVRDLAMLKPTGGQERGYRGGTENVPAILGFAAALEADGGWLTHIDALRSRLDVGIRAAGGIVVGEGAPRLATIGSYRLPGVAANAQLVRLDLAGIAVSAGSACSSGSLRPSHVLAAMGWSEDAAREVIRVSFGPATSAADIDAFLAAWTAIAGDARRRAA